MAAVRNDSANWRLFGGGGLLAGGLLWLIGAIVGLTAPGAVTTWLTFFGLLIIGIAMFFVAFGQTGSNGAVGGSVLGKIALVAFGIAFVLLALPTVTPLPDLRVLIAILLIAGGIISALVVYQKGVARGAARWFLFVPVVVGVIWAVTAFLGLVAFDSSWVVFVLSASIAITGALYLFNRRDLG
jgi:hypothetical protein